MPKIDTDNCMSCGQCVDICQMSAIDTKTDFENEKGYKQYEINQDICIECGECLKFDCPGECIHE